MLLLVLNLAGTLPSPAAPVSSPSLPTRSPSGSDGRSTCWTQPDSRSSASLVRAKHSTTASAAPAVILGAITGIGGGILRDILVRQIPVVLQEGLYAIPALVGAAIVVGAAAAGAHGPAAPIIGAAVCFVIRLAGLTLDLNLPRARHVNRE
jgi:Glycine transporter